MNKIVVGTLKGGSQMLFTVERIKRMSNAGQLIEWCNVNGVIALDLHTMDGKKVTWIVREERLTL